MTNRVPGPLYAPETLQTFLGRHGLGAIKGLGQHFLVSESVVGAIVQAATGCVGVLEIGPGPGVLTQPLSERASQVIAIEIDRRMGPLLAESAPLAEVRHLDALTTDLSAVLDELPRPRVLVSNLPYYITGPLLQRISEVHRQLDRAVLMMQKEVALRLLAEPRTGERGSLSVYIQAHFELHRLIQVPAIAFMPPPRVDSMVLVLTPRATEFSPGFFQLVRIGFAQPRKTLANNLANGFHRPRDEVIDWIEQLGMTEKARAQELTESEWVSLASFIDTRSDGRDRDQAGSGDLI